MCSYAVSPVACRKQALNNRWIIEIELEKMSHSIQTLVEPEITDPYKYMDSLDSHHSNQVIQ